MIAEINQNELIAALIGAAVCAVFTISFYVFKVKKLATLAQQESEQHQAQQQVLLAKQDELNNQIIALSGRAGALDAVHQERDLLRTELAQLRQNNNELNARYESQQAHFTQLAKAQDEKLIAIQETEKRLTAQFENLANRIFEQKSESFSKLNKTGLDSLLGPLKDQIEGFKRQISDQHIREGQERASLKTEILSLKALNQRITEEASALTLALKGDNKKQGNWGEVVLERILSQSGLREGHEFETQVSVRSDEGKQLQPDVIVHLPNDKDVIIDSKVSLSAYERYFNCESDDEKRVLLREHVNSIKTHIKGLGKKDYQALPGIKTLDYVLMFVPVEPAFLLAIDEDPELVSFALNQNIMLVSPTNLLVALRTINNIWQYEYQNQNAQKIAQHGAKLYDKFAGFIVDMEKLGKTLDTTQKHFDSAFNKLSQGRGNIVRQVEQFRELGVQPNKRLSNSVLEDEAEEDASTK